MRRRFTACIIALAMAVSFIPQTALAAAPDLRIAGNPVAPGEHQASEYGGTHGTVRYNSATNTLELDDVFISATTSNDESSGIFYASGDELTIHLIGNNELLITADANGIGYANAIYSKSALTITADTDASLTLKAQRGTGGNYGISAHKGLTITGGNIKATGGDSGDTMGDVNYGIYVDGGMLNISGGSVTAVANNTVSSGLSTSFGIFCDVGEHGDNNNGDGNITISNAIVSATGGAAETSGGIMSKYHLWISDNATVAATGGNDPEPPTIVVQTGRLYAASASAAPIRAASRSKKAPSLPQAAT